MEGHALLSTSRPYRQVTTTEAIDPAETVLATLRDYTKPKTYAEPSKQTDVPKLTSWHHEHGRLSRKDAVAKK